MPDLSASAWRVLEYLDAETDLNQRFPDVIGRRLGLDAHELGDVLHELAASGLARARPGGWYDLTSEGRARSEDYRAEGAKTVFGDYVAGDKVVGDKVGGDKIVAPAPAAPGEAAQPPQRRPAARTWLVAGGLVLLIAVVAALVLSVSPPATLPATPLPEPTGTLPRRPAVNDPALVATGSLEVRDGPGPDHPLLAIADPGARLAVAEDWDEAAFKVGEEGAWVRVRTAGEVEGWAAAAGLDFSEGAYPMPLDDFYLGRDGEQSFEDDLGPRHFTDWHLIADRGAPIYAGPNGGYVVKVHMCDACTDDGPSALDQGVSVDAALRAEAWGWGHGNYVVVRYPNRQLPGPTRGALALSGLEGADVFCLYAHLDTINVVEGQALPPNAQLGTVGRTGYALNPHLELEVHVGYSDSAEPHHHLTPTRAGLEVYIGPSPGTQVVTRIDPGVYVMVLEDWATASVKLGHPDQLVKVRIPSQRGWEDGWVEAEHLEFTHMDAWLSLIWFEPDILFDQVAIPGPTPTPPLTTPTPTTTPTLSNSPTSTSTPTLTLTPIMSPTDRLSPSPTATSATRGYPCSATIADSLANMLNVVRSYPSTTAPFQEPVRPGQAIIVLTKRETPSDTWYQVANLENNVLGWIVAEYLVFSMDCPE